jgi:hypothetical protein
MRNIISRYLVTHRIFERLLMLPVMDLIIAKFYFSKVPLGDWSKFFQIQGEIKPACD